MGTSSFIDNRTSPGSPARFPGATSNAASKETSYAHGSIIMYQSNCYILYYNILDYTMLDYSMLLVLGARSCANLPHAGAAPTASVGVVAYNSSSSSSSSSRSSNTNTINSNTNNNNNNDNNNTNNDICTSNTTTSNNNNKHNHNSYLECCLHMQYTQESYRNQAGVRQLNACTGMWEWSHVIVRACKRRINCGGPRCPGPRPPRGRPASTAGQDLRSFVRVSNINGVHNGNRNNARY